MRAEGVFKPRCRREAKLRLQILHLPLPLMASRVRRKPAPAIDLDVDAALLTASDAVSNAEAGEANLKKETISTLPARHSFALYAAPPLSPVLGTYSAAPSPTASSSAHDAADTTGGNSGRYPHYTRRRAQSTASPTPMPATPTRTRLARLLLPNPSSPTRERVRKHTISTPAPAEFPPALLPPGLAALSVAPSRPMALSDLPLAIETCPSASSASSRASGETDATSPPASPCGKPAVKKPPPLAALAPPTAADLARAASLPLVAPSGVRVPFGALLGMRAKDDCSGYMRDSDSMHYTTRRRTLVVFLRHFWCPLCQDYMVALASAVRAACGESSDAKPTSIPISIPPSTIHPSSTSTPASEPEPEHEHEQDHPTPVPAGHGAQTEAAEPRALRACGALGCSAPPAIVRIPSIRCIDPNTDFKQDAASSVEVGAEQDEDGETDADADADTPTETHLLLVAPGAHTLAARYLASFGFPAALLEGEGMRFDLGDPWGPASDRQTVGGEPSATGYGGAGGGARIASVRMVVDPRPAEGVYAALGMGWAPGIGGPASPPTSPVASTFSATQRAGAPAIPRVATSPVLSAISSHAAGFAFPLSPTLAGLSPVAPLSPLSHTASTLGLTPVGSTQAPVPADPHAAPESYVAHRTLAGVGAVLLRALRAGMPVWERGGDVRLLGGEFVFEVGTPADIPPLSLRSPASDDALRCTYAHRMQTTRGHANVRRVFQAAGVWVPPAIVENAKPLPRSASSVLPRSLLHSASTTIMTALPRPASTTAAAAPVVPAFIPRSMSTPRAFLRFAGPRGGRPPANARATRDGAGVPAVNAPGPKELNEPALVVPSRERTGIPRSASTPPGWTGLWEGKAAAIWEGRAGAMWEGRHGTWGTRSYTIWEGREPERVREPAIPVTLTASSSRPWALAAAGSSASLASDNGGEFALALECEGGGGDGEVRPVPVLSLSCASESSDSLSFSSKAGAQLRLRAGKVSSGSSGSEAYTDADGDDERSDGEAGRPFPRSTASKDHAVGRGRTHGNLYGNGHGRTQSESSGATHAECGYDFGSGYKGDGYGGDEAWMRLRALSLARLRARKDARREGGHS
ncbi:hypothetical protein B0H15DRAFT_932805 [Mycena belliarum]|uniref:Uncharacterized protein n=1 Tax=Mycena belliarum TaxID=1033014 RepID=A0AAD6U1P6_9AGAR|nr:hypothetical protein B0H15DRAFT_932805 [Mycena belliae]